MNTADVLKERERLVAIMAEGRTARAKIALINRLLVLYGDNVPDSALEPDDADTDHPVAVVVCPVEGCAHEIHHRRGWAGGATHHLKAHGLDALAVVSVREQIGAAFGAPPIESELSA